jgi:cell fate regulator YaaT (PSP1 superfamily)
MAIVIGVRFKSAGKVYYFDPAQLEVQLGDRVIVETANGTEMGEVVMAAKEVAEESITQPLKRAVRLATAQDDQRAQENRAFEEKALGICEQKIAQLGLDMKLVGCEYAFDRTKIIFYFTSGGRVDFRELVKILAQVFRIRIELRQIGVRDEAKMLGGLGSCGNEVCCRRFLGDFQPVTIRMAREQGLSLNPTKISGLCGRLMCCLKYEQDTYEAVRKKMPKVGKTVITPDGEGTVVEINVITETVRVNTGEVREYPLDQVTRKHADAKQAHGSEPDAQADDVQQDDAQADDVQEE